MGIVESNMVKNTKKYFNLGEATFAIDYSLGFIRFILCSYNEIPCAHAEFAEKKEMKLLSMFPTAAYVH